ncbi:MAG TPA: MBL fold metallo-hydrolase [Bacteroidia bacterium]|nr:MBL fold metallo-hydrolase [Bacteroidia bacterium]
MRIEYICHSCLFIDTGDTTLVFDPWFKGSVYMNQWFLFPGPVETTQLAPVKNILYSHGHEDHLHLDSLKELNKDANIFYPFQWRRGAKEFFSENGFNKLTEAVSFKDYRISPTTTVTYIGFALESVIVVQVGETVIVNLNDALNSHHQNVVEMFLREIKKRWPKIDYLFSGWSGAGYFPNTVHYKTKNDFETGLIREQYFAHNFAKIVQVLQPERAIPFGPGFALLNEDKRWINEVKFDREKFEPYYSEHLDKNHNIEFFVINPGDYFDENGLQKISPWHKRFEDFSIAELVEQEFTFEMKATENVAFCSEEEAEQIRLSLKKCLDDNRPLFDPFVLSTASFSIRIDNLKTNNFFNVRFIDGQFFVTRESEPHVGHRLLIRTKSHLLHYAVENEWGGDVLTIGYGIDVDVYDELTLEQNLDIVCVRLITRYPTASGSLRKDPFRAINYFIKHPMMGKLAIKQKLKLRNTINKFPYNERDHWISWSKCDLCKVCNLPLLSWEMGEQMKIASGQ